MAELIWSGFTLVWFSLFIINGFRSKNLTVRYFSKTNSWCVPEKYEDTIVRMIKWTESAFTNDISQVAE
ncbi:hypothetical protein MSBRM_1835 [Methanosarcina barkeri MS]|uniref:Uncharacterized protein n=1 Tax=Methanosarcina barkeri MS TaxID=1434108 RepID=A0A0E3QTX6_METBA|nr:hypothetical protein MSBRM_1835 [Methanosarcina barkeri MS]